MVSTARPAGGRRVLPYKARVVRRPQGCPTRVQGLGLDCRSAIGGGFVLGNGVNRGRQLLRSEHFGSRAASTPTGRCQLGKLQKCNRDMRVMVDSAPLENCTSAIQGGPGREMVPVVRLGQSGASG